ncbi:LacI family DNA-binding transcriptional regulator [Vibrio sp. F13]|uniref:LacI family DNA-binding transcriptional regulator n=1 Tax=Vibrio sp. F13 TaxID=2070777 RepID=UPI0010BD06CE|nr:LacI family DNA-binding transcriptional regulator [Vibrio sp. F13]TKF54670.1 LacI family DNA-binding transcriptional regulator [Vibrio sp. F13]
MSRATLKTIAQYTGLSVTTVSRALKDGDDVKLPTREKVKAAAKKLGYRPNPSGVGLRTGINYNICAILPVTKPGDMVGDIGALGLIEGFASALRSSPYQLTVLPVRPDEDPMDQVRHAVENNLCGGVILNMTKTKDERVSYLHDNEIPFVTFGQTEMSIEHAFVDIDNTDTIYRAASHLIEKKRKNIRLLTISDEYTFVWHKYYGARRAARENGLEFDLDKNVIFESDNVNYRELGQELSLSEDNIDGIICSSEINASGIIAGIQDAGKVVGEDIDVLLIETCDFPSYFTPPISGYRQDFHEIGRELIDFLIKRIQGVSVKKLQSIKKCTFHER